MRYYIIFSYDGTNFCGYQTQPGLRTVQGKLEEALKKINNNQRVIVTSSGRTDRGVHALYQVAHFDLNINITTIKLKRALNSNLPLDIHVIAAGEVSCDFHARYHVKEKEYCYTINLGEYNPLERNFVFQYNYQLNIDKMNCAMKYFLGTNDYRAFVSENHEKENCIRTITDAYIKQDIKDPLKYHFIFRGSGFLKYQVRNMVGLLIKVGEEKIEPKEVLNILNSKDRTKAGSTAPACGLKLVNVTYQTPFDKVIIK